MTTSTLAEQFAASGNYLIYEFDSRAMESQVGDIHITTFSDGSHMLNNAATGTTTFAITTPKSITLDRIAELTARVAELEAQLAAAPKPRQRRTITLGQLFARFEAAADRRA
jgi:hypothetical protein